MLGTHEVLNLVIHFTNITFGSAMTFSVVGFCVVILTITQEKISLSLTLSIQEVKVNFAGNSHRISGLYVTNSRYYNLFTTGLKKYGKINRGYEGCKKEYEKMKPR